MKRRDLLGKGSFGAIAFTSLGLQSSQAATTERIGYLFVHGSWHGAWCWGGVSAHLERAGYACFAVDLPGHGLNAILPSSFGQRPLDPAAFATEPSALAAYQIDDYANAVLEAAKQARATGIDKLYLVGHSMGGVPITFAAAKAPDLFEGLIYIAALAPTPGKPAGAYLGLPDQAANSKLGPAIVADPAVIGALRIDPRSQDSAYLGALKEALAHDVDDTLLQTVMHYLTPDAPVALYGDVATFPASFQTLSRSFIICTQDKTVLPSTAEAIIQDMDKAWTDEATKVLRLSTSHEAMFANPEQLARLLIQSLD